MSFNAMLIVISLNAIMLNVMALFTLLFTSKPYLKYWTRLSLERSSLLRQDGNDEQKSFIAKVPAP
jgi:hypothetical protein